MSDINIPEKELETLLNKKPSREEDKPLNTQNPLCGYSVKELNEYTKAVNEAKKDTKSFKMVYVCIGSLLSVYVLQVFVTVDKEVTTSVIELLKAVIFSACGYIFGKSIS